jgi:4-carboxymuconolactone decarboxylase
MARIPYFDMETLDQEAREYFDRLPRLNLFRMAGHGGKIGRDAIRLGSAILRKGSLDHALREMAIIRTGILCGSEYEVHQHKKISRLIGMPEEKIEALSAGSASPVFSDQERLILRFTEEVVANVKASDETFNAAAAIFSHGQLVELVLTVGYYMMMCRFLETFEIDIETLPVS